MSTLKFGKYAGVDIRQVPLEYLQWLHERTVKSGEEIATEIERRERLESANQPLIERLIQSGYRALAKQLHPDVGGTTEQMQELNDVVDTLRHAIRRK